MPNTNDPEVRQLRRMRQNLLRRVRAGELSQADALKELHAAIRPTRRGR